jgi:hypothetical protein
MADRVAVVPSANEKLQMSYANAAQGLAGSLRDVERASRDYLNELMKLPAAERFSHLADSLLTPADALKLTRSLQPGVPAHRKYRAPLSSKLRGVIRVLRLGRPLSATTLLVLVMVAIYGTIAWFNTAHLVQITRPVNVTVQYADGSERPWQMDPRAAWQLMRTDGDKAVIRFWVSGKGYQQVAVPSSIIRRFDLP